MTTVSAQRISISDLKEIVRSAFEGGGDYTHNTEWRDGGPAEVPTPAAHIMTAGILIDALPEPDPGGTLDQQEAATSILRVISGRLTGAYIIRAHSLVRRLTEESGSSGSRLTVTVPSLLSPRLSRCPCSPASGARALSRSHAAPRRNSAVPVTE